MEGAAPTLRQSTSAQSLLTDSVGSQNLMLSHSMSKSDIFAMRRRLEAQWRMNRTRQIHELRRTFIHFCVNEGLGTATTAPTEQYDRYQADAGIKLLLPKKEVRPSRNAPFARGCSRSARTCTHKRLTALVPCDAAQMMRMYGRPGNMFCWTALIRHLLANPDLVDLPKPLIPEPNINPSQMLRTLRATYNGPAYNRALHMQSMEMLPPMSG